jgi:hypothetical protein
LFWLFLFLARKFLAREFLSRKSDMAAHTLIGQDHCHDPAKLRLIAFRDRGTGDYRAIAAPWSLH